MHASIIVKKPLAALTALIAWFGLALQLYLSLRLSDSMGMGTAQGLVIYLGYFTVLTNLLVAVAATAQLAWPESAAGRFFARPHAVGWVAVSIAFVGIAYFTLLRHVWNPQGLQLLADVLMHYVVPSLMVLYSAITLRRATLSWSAPLWWSLYPLLYFLYVLVRGALLGRYPYSFIDVAKLGYALTLRNAVLLWIAFVVLAYVLIWLWRGLGEAGAVLNPRGRTRP
jgi:hypothetical protein